VIDVIGIDHICLLVSDLEKSREYYEKLFNVACKFHPRDDKTLMLETNKIHFFLKEIKMPSEFYENQHLSFETLNIDMAAEKLKQCKIENFEIGVFNDFRFNNYKWLEWRDLDGIRLECIEKI
jgi:catechol 2,3-dioxygenase-like lactoylglutathione lyase family enzyme